MGGIVKKRFDNNVIGQNFYVKSVGEEYIRNVYSWLNYLGIEDLFPNKEDFKGKVVEVGEKLRNIGGSTFFGRADLSTGDIYFRPGDYAALLHEITHTNPDLEGKLLSEEGGAFAIEIFAAGDFDGHLRNLFSSSNYTPEQKAIGRIISEASLVLGRGLFDYLRSEQIGEQKTSEVALLKDLGGLVNEYHRQFIRSDMSPKDYLLGVHRISDTAAEYLLSLTKDTKWTILKSTTQSKKEVIGAFKSLASFYHINLGYSLADSIEKTDEHFMRGEALTLHKTLMKGAKEVFAKLKEYGYDIKMCREISEAMINQGASKSILYAQGIPKLLELTGHFGPEGERLLAYSLSNPELFNILTIEGLATSMLSLSEIEPEQIPLIFSELKNYKWSELQKLRHTSRNFSIESGYHNLRSTLFREISQKDKARLAALSIYITSFDQEQASELIEHSFINSSRVDVNMEKLLKETAAKPITKLEQTIKNNLRKLPRPKKE
ncbi:hypothetical protein GOV05_04875 [Candidatus Woesearchaeota archaeon]|nr:hypothetical protein [Candidatus Woesearchaeota archaeon]